MDKLEGPRRKKMTTTGTMAKSNVSSMAEADVTMVGELAMKETELKTDSLSDAKDKAQFTATTAMSIVHITLLKEVLDRGPEVEYYQVSLGLILTALVLQIIVGIIALITANVRKYYSKYRDEPLDDIAEHVFHCKCKSKKALRRERRIRMVVMQSNLVDLSQGDMMKSADGKGKGMDMGDFTDDDADAGCSGCCKLPCYITGDVHPSYEYDILERYDVYSELMVRGQIAMIKPQEELGYMQRSIASAKKEIEIQEAKLLGKDGDTGGIQTKLDELKGKLDEYLQKGKQLEQKLQEEKIIQKQGEVLSKYAMAIKKNRVLKMISFWQHCINYMLYFIFIINAFIAGFGMATVKPDGTLGEIQKDSTPSTNPGASISQS